MNDKDHPRPPSHGVYAVIVRDGKPSTLFPVGVMFPRSNGRFLIILKVVPLRGPLLCLNQPTGTLLPGDTPAGRSGPPIGDDFQIAE